MSSNVNVGIDVERLIAEVAARHGILLKRDDPAFALITVAEALLEASAARIERRLTDRLVAFDNAVENAERRAGQILAHKVRHSTTSLAKSHRPESPLPNHPAANTFQKFAHLGAFFIGAILGGAVTLLLVK